jgi:hypothetical protein
MRQEEKQAAAARELLDAAARAEGCCGACAEGLIVDRGGDAEGKAVAQQRKGEAY